jgi:putative tricarboxylic transport membrane protein
LSGIDTRFLVPFVYLLALVSIFISSPDARFLFVTVILAVLGYAFQKQGWPRAPFVIGLVLGPAAEDALIKSLGIWGPGFFLRPVSLLLIAILLIGFATLGKRLKRASALQEKAGLHGP